MVDDKPLPVLPAGSKLVILSVEARNHRAALIGHFLKDLHEPGIENRRDGWQTVFENVLDDLAKHIDSADWLNGIKRGAEFKKLARSTKVGQTTPKSEHLGEAVVDNFERETGDINQANNRPDKRLPLQQLRMLTAAPPPPPGQAHVSHLVLCMKPHGIQSLSVTEELGFTIVPANVGCTFSVGNFILPDSNRQDDAGNILFGLDGLEVDTWGSPLRLVGGSFALKGANSPLQHQLLANVLKLAIYAHFSLILEQHILSDSSVHLTLTRPKVPRASPSTPTTTATESLPEGVRFRPKYTIFPSRFTKFLARHNLGYRGAVTVGDVGSRGPLDLVSFPSHQVAEIPPNKPSLENPHEGHLAGRLRRLSIIGEKRLSFLKGHRESSRERKGSMYPSPFSNALRLVENSRGFLSTSIGVKLPLPKIMTDLAEKERSILSQSEVLDQQPVQKLSVDEDAALASLLGWGGEDTKGRGMSGIPGFLTQQEISVLISRHPLISTGTDMQQRMPSASISSSASGYSTIQNTIRTGKAPIADSSRFPPCSKPFWVTYRYYSSGEDFLLGDWVTDIVKKRHNPCSAMPRCGLTEGQHDTRIFHDGIRIVVRLTECDIAGEMHEDEEKQPVEMNLGQDKISVWESCMICAAKTSQKLMMTGSLLFSYAKYLELLIYSPLPCTLTPSLCEHTTPPPAPWSSLPSSRFNIVRHFTTSSVDISFSLSPNEEVFELRIPRLQIIRGVDVAASPFANVKLSLNAADEDLSNKKTELRRQIRKWWEDVSDHMDKIEQALTTDSHLLLKALPRLPSGDDAYTVFDTDPLPGLTAPIHLTSVRPSSPKTPSESSTDASYFRTASISFAPQTPKSPPELPVVPSEDDSERLLVSLRQNFQRTERSLYSHLAKTPDSSLNEIRRAFLFAGRGTQRRLRAWQVKHLDSAKSKAVGDFVSSEPEWWGKGFHVVPSGNIIVRENDWGSIIAHTLSTVDYQIEMAQLSSNRTGIHTNRATSSSSAPSTPSTLFSLNPGYRLFSSSRNQPDPDQEDIDWNEQEHYSAIISRKEHRRDASSLPFIRDVLGRKVTPNQHTVDETSALALNGVSSTALKASPSIVHNAESIGGAEGVGFAQKADKLLGYDEATPTTSQQGTSKPESLSATKVMDCVIEEEILSSAGSHQSEYGLSQQTQGLDTPILDTKSLPPPLPAKDDIVINREPAPSDPTTLPNPSGFTAGLTTGLNTAMKYLSGVDSPSRFLVRGLSNARKPGSRLASVQSIDDRPHIRYDWTMGKRIKFSCTVYYAKQFELLRQRCGVHESFVKSLSESTNWAAEGGKSKSNFWKTSDDRFIIKTLVNAWNVADLQVLTDHAPFYFRYMDATASKPTVLAKLMGFYTVEIKNLETGVVQAKVDLLVMENIFYGRNILKKFDLKGIQGRKVKTPGNASKTLFDGEWIEGQQKTLTLVRPYSKVLLHDAITNDAEFLSKSNIMDYSLLLGVDEEAKEIACGLVDTVGSYTFAKTLEYKAKHGLQAGKEVTVLPPSEYQERFVNTLADYFVPCPDKWSKSLDQSKIFKDPVLLPSVL